MIRAIPLLAVAAAIAGVAMPRGARTAAVPQLIITLSPAVPGPGGNIPYVDVRIAAPDMHVAAGKPLLRLPLVSSNVTSIADSLQNLRVTDSHGALALTTRDDPQSEPMPFRHWLAGREISGTVVVRYRAPITNALNSRGAAPPLELRTEDGGFSGDASTFLVLPETDHAYRIALRWNFAVLGRKAVGLSTLGGGNADNAGNAGPFAPATTELSLDAVYGRGLYFMGGHVHTYPAPLPGSGFMSAWQGTPPFDGRGLMRWTQSLYGSYLRFFHAPPGQPYKVFLRRNLVNAGGGVEVGHAFVGTFDRETKAEDLELTLAHEMVHTFVGGLDAPQGLASSWYSEGLAVYYERMLPWRAGRISTADFLTDLNRTAARYYTDLLGNTPNSEIPARFWADTRVRVLPYDRGSLYFAQLNAELREASHGRRSLDDLVLRMIGRRRHGLRVDEQAWIALVQKALGARGVAQFHAMMDGRLVLPGSDAFGRCFERTTTPLRRYELGFDSQVLAEPRRIVRGLLPGTAAARAGLRDGDRIVKPIPQDAIQADQHAKLTLLIERAGRTFPITYLPRGAVVQAYQWQRRPDVPPGSCGGSAAAKSPYR
jgi:predicted metalloprotease with PDZ domain